MTKFKSILSVAAALCLTAIGADAQVLVEGQTITTKGVMHLRDQITKVVVVPPTNTKAVGVLTFTGNVSNADTVTIGSDTYTFVTSITDVAATGTITSNNTNVSNNDTVTIGTKTYTFKTALTPAEGEVLISTTADLSLGNLILAINHGATNGTNYQAAVANTQVSAATSVTSHAFAVTALAAGTAGNSIGTTKSATTLSWGAADLTGGATNNVAKNVKVGGTEALSITYLNEAINGGANAGVDYAALTVASTTVTGVATSTTETVTSDVVGTAGEIASTKSSSNASWGSATLTGGITFYVNATTAGIFSVTLGAGHTNNITILNNEYNGRKFDIEVIQDGTGSRIPKFDSRIRWAGGSAPTLTTTANYADIVSCIDTGTVFLTSVKQNFATQ